MMIILNRNWSIFLNQEQDSLTNWWSSIDMMHLMSHQSLIDDSMTPLRTPIIPQGESDTRLEHGLAEELAVRRICISLQNRASNLAEFLRVLLVNCP